MIEFAVTVAIALVAGLGTAFGVVVVWAWLERLALRSLQHGGSRIAKHLFGLNHLVD